MGAACDQLMRKGIWGQGLGGLGDQGGRWYDAQVCGGHRTLWFHNLDM